MCHCRRRDDDLPSGYDPIADVHVNPVRHPDDVKVHSEAQGLGIGGLKDWQAIDIEPGTAVRTFERTGVNLGPHASKQLRVTTYLKDGPRCGSDGVSCPVRKSSSGQF